MINGTCIGTTIVIFSHRIIGVILYMIIHIDQIIDEVTILLTAVIIISLKDYHNASKKINKNRSRKEQEPETDLRKRK